MAERKTPEKMFAELTPENQEKVIRLIETLVTSRLNGQPEPGYPDLNRNIE